MADHMTPDQVRDEILAAMGPRLGPVYHALWNEVALLHAKWHEFKELYGTSPARVEILNQAAAWFFHLVQDALWEETLLHLARLTDSPQSVGKDNLTIRQLPALVEDAALREEIERLLTDLQAKTLFARDWRNRRIAHRDLAMALGQGATPLVGASRNHVDEALRSISELLNRVNAFHARPEVAFDQVLSPMTGSVHLLYVLRDGLDAATKRRERLQAGKPDPDDWKHREI